MKRACCSCRPEVFAGRSTVGKENLPRQKLAPRPPAFFKHVYAVRPREDHHDVDLVSDALPFGRLWYGERVIRVYDAAGKVIEAQEHAGEFKEW
jgi:hypothetical protein